MKRAFLSVCFLILGFSTFSQVQTNAIKKATRLTRGDYFKDLSNADGGYLFFNFGMRYHDKPNTEDLQFESLSGLFGANYGYRKRNLSFETGLQFYYHEWGDAKLATGLEPIRDIGGEKNTLVIPFLVRYDIPFSEDQNFRFGANFSVNWLSFPLNNEYLSGETTLSNGDKTIVLSYDSEKKSPFFFKTGIHGRLRFLKSAFWMFQVSKAFTFGPNRTYTFYQGGKEYGTYGARINGFIWEMGYVLPLQVLSRKLEKKE